MEKEIKVDGMSCNNCVKHVTEALKQIEGVSNVTVSLAEKKATISSDKNIDISVLKSVIEDAGYDFVG